jgi:hypothetical protein
VGGRDDTSERPLGRGTYPGQQANGRPVVERPCVSPCVAQKVALSPQAQEPEEFGFSMEKPEASRLSFQSITEPWR